MKTTIKTLSLLVISLLISVAFAACSDDTDPADSDVFAGTYKGRVSYTSVDPAKSITAEDGEIIVTKVGSTYNFHFNKSIPDLKGVKFEKKGDNTYVSIGSGLTGITINESKLNMLVVKGGETWTANCKR
jgi:hypothetical protein